MTNSPDNWFSQSVEILTYNRNQRVWSIIVTLFGDLAQSPGDQISGTTLSRITEPMAIKPEAMRVALHRLRNDGWITSEKSGRASFYRLTKEGMHQSQAASPRIYTRNPAADGPWQLCIAEPGPKSARAETEKRLMVAGFKSVTTGVFLRHSDQPAPENCMVMNGSVKAVPDWLKTKFGSDSSIQSYAEMEDALDRFRAVLDTSPKPTPVQVATLRTIIVHIWRRALFSHPDLPRNFFPDAWRGEECRIKVLDTLDQLGVPSLRTLEENG